jgi:hypothetical protein
LIPKGKEAMANEIDHIKLMSFLGVTILIPVISGICLSLCLNIANNMKCLTLFDKRKNTCKTDLDNCREVIKVLSTKRANLVEFERHWQVNIENSATKKDKISTIAQQFAEAYSQAYKSGFLRYNGKDLFKMGELLQNGALFESAYAPVTNLNNTIQN